MTKSMHNAEILMKDFRIVIYASIFFKSSSGVLMGAILYVSTRKFNTLGDINAGSDGPSRIFLMPRCSRVKRMHTAFCSYQESTMERGS